MALRVSEETQDLLSRRTSIATLFRLDRQRFQLMPFHRAAQLSFDQCLHEQREEVHGEERLDATRVLQEHRSYFPHIGRVISGQFPVVRQLWKSLAGTPSRSST